MEGGVIPERSQALIDFWFGPPGDPDRENHRQIWFKCPPEHDDMLRRLFLADYEQRGSRCALDAWEAAPKAPLALRAAASTRLPRNICGAPSDLCPPTGGARCRRPRPGPRLRGRGFAGMVASSSTMPLHHSEDLADQGARVAALDRKRCLMIAIPRIGSVASARKPPVCRYALSRRRIERFGCFPHQERDPRPASTPEESLFMKRARGPS